MEYACQRLSAVVKYLHKAHSASGMFTGLGKGVFRPWLTTNLDGKACCTESVLAAVEWESLTGGLGWSKMLVSGARMPEKYSH